MTDLNEALDQIKARAQEFESTDDILDAIGAMEKSQADVPRLVGVIEAVHNVAENYPLPHKRDDPTGEIASAIETFGDAIQDAYTSKLAGEDDD